MIQIPRKGSVSLLRGFLAKKMHLEPNINASPTRVVLINLSNSNNSDNYLNLFGVGSILKSIH